ncbi:MAG: hypothetical protein Q9220_006478 [cf. Caloplaca sp. 1 TL-2023]
MLNSLLNLPSETTLAIAHYLSSAADYVHFSLVHDCIALRLSDRGALAKTLKRIAAYSTEYDRFTAGSISPNDALLSIYDRQRAFAAAKPASTIALGDSQAFVYGDGIVAHTKGEIIRVLHVHQARRTEGVVYCNLIGPQLLGIECSHTQAELLHLQKGFLTIKFHGETSEIGCHSWLLTFYVDRYELRLDRLVLSVDLWTSEELIIRNDRRYLCAITPTGSSHNGRHREWVCQVWNFDNSSLSKPLPLQIPDLAVSELGQTLVFEIFDAHLYAISTQSPFELDEPQWTSHYSCYRFPLENPHSLTLETLKIWRRHHQEGPINDLWTDLKFLRDESTGELNIIEARKEWAGGSSIQKRTWYRQNVPSFWSTPPQSGRKSSADHTLEGDHQSDSTPWSGSVEEPPYLLCLPPDKNALDIDPSRVASGIDQPPAHPRLDCFTHPEYLDTPQVVDNAILAKSKHRAYIQSASSFLDIVVGERKSGPRTGLEQQIKLRIGARVEMSPLDAQGLLYKPWINTDPIEGSELHYSDLGIRVWPPDEAPVRLLDFLNGELDHGPTKAGGLAYRTLGDITAVSDERLIIYLIKKKGAGEDEVGKLILINFDEHIHFWHEEWVPQYLNLAKHREPCHRDPEAGPAEQVATGASHKTLDEPDQMDIDGEEYYADDHSEGQTSEESDDDDDDYGGDFQTVDEVDCHKGCEECDEDRPLNMHWFAEHKALWIDVQEGFCFI